MGLGKWRKQEKKAKDNTKEVHQMSEMSDRYVLKSGTGTASNASSWTVCWDKEAVGGEK